MSTPPSDPTAVILRSLDIAHDAMRWKLDGLSEYDLRRPLTRTGTNLLGIAKHVAWVELGYFGEVFGRPHDLRPPPNADEINADMYARADESVADVLDLFAMARDHAHRTLDALPLEAEGHVPSWGANNPVTLHLIAVHMLTELHRHLGQMDILREALDGAAGHRDGVDNLPEVAASFWPTHVAELEAIARHASEPDPP
ncbi:MAG: DinB family protein [Actinomycetota bacterium]